MNKGEKETLGYINKDIDLKSRTDFVNAKIDLILSIGMPSSTYINFLHPLYSFWHRSFNSSVVSSREYNCPRENKQITVRNHLDKNSKEPVFFQRSY